LLVPHENAPFEWVIVELPLEMHELHDEPLTLDTPLAAVMAPFGNGFNAAVGYRVDHVNAAWQVRLETIYAEGAANGGMY